MSGDSFVDSNIWLYAFMDESSPKHALAKTLIERNSVVLKMQVVRSPIQKTCRTV
jgi:predicted nucleic acid-binding protein